MTAYALPVMVVMKTQLSFTKKDYTVTRAEFLKELDRRGGYSELTEKPGKALKKLRDDGFIELREYARCGFEMVRVDNVRLTEAGRLALASILKDHHPL